MYINIEVPPVTAVEQVELSGCWTNKHTSSIFSLRYYSFVVKMAAASIKGSDALHTAPVGSGQAKQRGEEEELHHQQIRVSGEYRGDVNNSDNGRSNGDDAGVVLPERTLEEQAGDLRRRKDGELSKQPGSAAAAVAAVADAYGRRATEAVGEEKEEEQNDKQPNQTLHGREPILLWNVKKGLAPIAAVDSCTGGECALETPSSAAAGSFTKVAASLEEETPRTSIPSVEVSPTNNFSWKNCVPLCAPSTSTTFNSTSSSSTSSPSRAGGADDADGSEGSCYLTAAAQSPAEILVAAATAVANCQAADLADTPAASTAGTTEYPADTATATETVPVDPSGKNSGADRVQSSILIASDVAEAAAPNTISTTLAPQQLTTTAGDAAAVLSSPAALSLLATPCPVGDAAVGAPLCSTDPDVAAVGSQDAAESTHTAQRPADKTLTSFELARAEDTAAVAPMKVEVAAAERVVATAESSIRSMIHLQKGMEYNAAAQRCDPEEVQNITTELQLHKEERQRLLLEESSDVSGLDGGATEFFPHEKGDWQMSLAEGSDADLMLLMRGRECFAAENDLMAAREEDTAPTAAEKDTVTLAGSAAVSGELGDDVGSPPSDARPSGTADRRGDSLLPWERRSQLKAAVGEDISSALISTSSSDASAKLLCREQQQQLGLVSTEDSSDVFKDAAVAVAPLSATSCCTDLSTSPFAVAHKGDVSPVSCCSSSSTASVTSPTGSPLSSASCGGPLSIAATGSTATVASSDGAADDVRDTVAAEPPESTPAEGGSGNVTEKDAPVSTGETRDGSVPSWYVGFRLPLGAEGRQVLLRRLRRAYHAAPPTTRDAVLASHGLYFSRVPFATVSDLFKLSHLLGVFDFAVQCSHEFGGSGAAGGSMAAGGGGAHGSRKSNHHSKTVNRNSNTNQRQLCNGTGNTGEERKVSGSIAEAVTDSPTQANLSLQLGVEPAVAAAAGHQRKNTGGTTTSKAGAAGAFGNCGGVNRKGKALDQTYPAESGATSRGVTKGRAATAALGFEGDLGVSPANARDGATGRGDAKTRDAETHTALKEAAAARSRCPQQRRSAAGRSSACRAAGRQQQSQQQRKNALKVMETPRRAGAAVGCCDGDDSSNRGEREDWLQHQHVLLQQLLQAGVADQSRSNDSGGLEGRNTAENIVALLTKELGKAAPALLLRSAGGGRSAPQENQQQGHATQQILRLQLQELAKTASSCRREGIHTDDSPCASRDTRVEPEQRQQQALQCLLTAALRGVGIQEPQQQQGIIAGGRENPSGGRTGGKRSCPSADTVLQHEQQQWCSRVSCADAAGEESAWEKPPHEAPVKTQAPSAAELLPLLTSAADQLRSNNCGVPRVEAAAVNPSYRGSLRTDGEVQSEIELNECHNKSTSSGSSFDWKRLLLENYLSSVREHQQQTEHRRQSNAQVYSTSGTFTPGGTRAGIIPTPSCGVAVAARNHPEPEEILQEEEITRLTKRFRTTRFPVPASLDADASPSVNRAGFSAAGAASGREIRAAPAATVPRAAPPARDGCTQAYTPEVEALLSALMTASGSSPGEHQQRRWTLSTVEEITRLLLQLNNSGSDTVAEEEAHSADPEECTNHLRPTDGLVCKHCSCNSNCPCGSNSCSRGTISSSYCSSNTTSCSSIGKDSCNFERNTGGRCSPPLTNDKPLTESVCIHASLTERTPTDGPVMPHHHGATGATYPTACQSKRRNMPADEPQERCGTLSFTRESSVSIVVEQLQQELSRRSGASSHEYSGNRNDRSNVAPNKNRGQTGNGSNNCRDAYTDVFSQVTSQLQLLSAQVLQQQEPDSAQRHHSPERLSDEQQYNPRIQAQQVYQTLQRRVNAPSALTPITTAAAQEESVAPGSGRLCSTEKATEYAANVQLLQLVELLQVQQRVSKLLSLFPKVQTASSPLSHVSAFLAAASPSPSSPAVTALPAPAGTAAPAAAFSSSNPGNTTQTDTAAIEPSTTLLAALASTLLESRAGAALVNNVKEAASDTSLNRASGNADLMNVPEERGINQPLQQVRHICDSKQQQQQRVPAPQRGPPSRGSNNKSNNSKGSTSRNSKGSGAKNTGRIRNNQSAERKFVSQKTEVVEDSAQTATENGLVRGKRERNGSERTAALLKQQETNAPNNCVAHSNSFSTCCSEDFADLCTGGSSSSSSLKRNHGSIRSVSGRICSAQATFERTYTPDSYSCNRRTEEDVSIRLE